MTFVSNLSAFRGRLKTRDSSFDRLQVQEEARTVAPESETCSNSSIAVQCIGPLLTFMLGLIWVSLLALSGCQKWGLASGPQNTV